MKISVILHRRQVIGLLASCIPLIAYAKGAASEMKQIDSPDSSSNSPTQFYLMSGWVLARNDLDFLSRGELDNVKRLQ